MGHAAGLFSRGNSENKWHGDGALNGDGDGDDDDDDDDEGYCMMVGGVVLMKVAV